MKTDEIKMIIFDMDGVILDSEPLHEEARQEMFREMNIVLDETFPDPVGKATDEFWALIFQRLGMEGDAKAKGVQHYRLVAEMVERNHIGASEGLVDVLQWAKKKGIKTAIASSSPRFLVDEVMRLLGIGKYFDCTVSGDEVERRKPNPDIYLKVLEEMGMTAEEAVAVEDSGTGVKAAKAAGIYCFGYLNPTSGPQEIGMADCQIRHLNEIMES